MQCASVVTSLFQKESRWIKILCVSPRHKHINMFINTLILTYIYHIVFLNQRSLLSVHPLKKTTQYLSRNQIWKEAQINAR